MSTDCVAGPFYPQQKAYDKDVKLEQVVQDVKRNLWCLIRAVNYDVQQGAEWRKRNSVLGNRLFERFRDHRPGFILEGAEEVENDNLNKIVADLLKPTKAATQSDNKSIYKIRIGKTDLNRSIGDGVAGYEILIGLSASNNKQFELMIKRKTFAPDFNDEKNSSVSLMRLRNRFRVVSTIFDGDFTTIDNQSDFLFKGPSDNLSKDVLQTLFSDYVPGDVIRYGTNIFPLAKAEVEKRQSEMARAALLEMG